MVRSFTQILHSCLFSAEADPIPCNSQAFQCNRGRCIHYRNVCDGVVDCQYGNDELDCPEYNEGIHTYCINVYRRCCVMCQNFIQIEELTFC